MLETAAAVDDFDAAIVTELVYNETKSEKKSRKFCNNVTLVLSSFCCDSIFNFLLSLAFLH